MRCLSDMLNQLVKKMRDVIELIDRPKDSSAGVVDNGDIARAPNPAAPISTAPESPASEPAASEPVALKPAAPEPAVSESAAPLSGESASGEPESLTPEAGAEAPNDAGAPASAQAAHSGDSSIPTPELERITADVIKGLKTVYDPEIPVDVYELGLIYKVDLSDDRLLTIDMTLTAPGCPVAGEMPGWVEGSVRGIDGVDDVSVNMVFEPPWTPERMSDEARLELGWM